MTDETATDQALMQRFADGDAEAFECLYRRHELRVWRYLERSVRDRAAADDLMQDVWFAVAREAPRYRPTARFTTWLYTLAHNRMVDWFRTNRPQVRLDDTDEEGAHAMALTDSRPGPPENVAAGQDAAALLEAVGRLPPLQQEAFILHADGGLSVEEIAAATGTSFETAKSRLRYARTRLRQLLAEYA